MIGPRGLMSDDGKPYPVYHALAAFLTALNAADEVVATTIDRTDGVAAVCLRGEAGDATFLVNLMPDEQAVTVRGLRAETATVRVLDETNALTGFSEPRPLDTPGGEATLTLLPYAIAEINSS